MVNRLDRPQSHGNSGEFPEIGHEPGMRIRRKSATRLQFAPKVLQLLPRNAPFQIGARIHPRRRVSLEINYVAIAALGACLQEMIEGYLVQSGGRRVGRNLSADAFLDLLSPNY